MQIISFENISQSLSSLVLLPLMMSFIYYLLDLLKMFISEINFNICSHGLYDFIFRYSTSIEFEICLTRLAHNIKIESDDGYNAIRYYIFKNYKSIKGIRYLKKIPLAANQCEIYDSNKFSMGDNFDKEFFKDLYLHSNKIHLPNKLVIISKYKHNKNRDEKKNSVYDTGEKFLFKVILKCNVYDSSKKNLDYLIKNYSQILKDYNHYRENKDNETQYCFVYDSHLKDTPYFNQLYIGNEYRGFDSIFFKEKKMLVQDIETFIQNPDFYYNKGKPYRKIILTHGEPGCGKTSIILGILNLLSKKYDQKRHLINLNLNNLTKKNLQNIFFNEEIYVNNNEDGKKLIPFNRRIYYIEEIDNYSSTLKRTDSQEESNGLINDIKKYLHDNTDENLNKPNALDELDKFIKTSKKTEDRLTIQDLLELFDGPLSLKNSEIIIMTTNHINKIDKALLRPGRVNNLIQLKKCRIKDIVDIIQFHYDEDIPELEINKLVSNKYTPAYISEACLKNESPTECINYILSNENNYHF